MKRLRVGIAFLIFFLTGCGSPGNQSFGPASQAAKGWSIQYSPSMPPTPTVGGPGTWYFDFPSDPNYPACVYNPDTLCHSVNYVTDSYSGAAAHGDRGVTTRGAVLVAPGGMQSRAHVQAGKLCVAQDRFRAPVDVW